MRLRLLVAPLLGAALVALAPAAPASATEFDFVLSGTTTVYADLSSCVTLVFGGPTTFVGSFTAAGAVFGPGTLTAPVAGATPIAGVNQTSYTHCLPGAYAGATAGGAVYTVHVSAASGADYVAELTCTVRNGARTCV